MPLRAGLTLSELLVVICIVAVLAGLLIAGIGGVRGAMRQAACQHNLAQIGAACLGYADDYRGLLPADRTFGDDDPRTSPAWFHRLPRYLGGPDARRGIFQCPSAECATPAVFTNAAPKSYKMNDRLDAQGRPRHCRLHSIRRPSEVVLFADAYAGETGTGQWGHLPATAVEPRHGGKANILFADLSVRAVAEPTNGSWLHALRWDPER